MITFNLHGYKPHYANDNAPLWPNELTIALNYACTALYADGQAHTYANISECMDAHECDAEHVQQWLRDRGEVHEAGQLAMAMAVAVCSSKSTRVSRLTHDAALYEVLDLFTGNWDMEALLELDSDGRLRVVATDQRLADDLGAEWLNSNSGEGVDRLLARGLLGGQ